jgi:hypothetical protein
MTSKKTYFWAGLGAWLGIAATVVARAWARNRRPILARPSSGGRDELDAESLAEEYASQSATGEGMAETSSPPRKALLLPQ